MKTKFTPIVQTNLKTNEGIGYVIGNILLAFIAKNVQASL